MHYEDHQWNIFIDLKFVALLIDLQQDFPYNNLFLCEWESRAREKHFYNWYGTIVQDKQNQSPKKVNESFACTQVKEKKKDSVLTIWQSRSFLHSPDESLYGDLSQCRSAAKELMRCIFSPVNLHLLKITYVFAYVHTFKRDLAKQIININFVRNVVINNINVQYYFARFVSDTRTIFLT